jgi:hypothetical protein
MNGFNQNFESHVTPGVIYDTITIRFNEYDKAAYQWGDYIMQDSTVIIAIPQGALSTAIIADLSDEFSITEYGAVCPTPPTTTTTTTS